MIKARSLLWKQGGWWLTSYASLAGMRNGDIQSNVALSCFCEALLDEMDICQWTLSKADCPPNVVTLSNQFRKPNKQKQELTQEDVLDSTVLLALHRLLLVSKCRTLIKKVCIFLLSWLHRLKQNTGSSIFTAA